MRFSLILIATLITPAVTLAQPAVNAANKAKAKESYRLASQSYDLGEYRDALTKFKEAYRYYEEPTFLFNIAQCHRQLGERQEAIRFFRTYLIKKPDAPNRTEVEQMMARLEAEEKSKPPIAALPSAPAASSRPRDAVATQPVTPTAVSAMPSVSSAPPAHVAARPIYKRWWLWAGLGVVAAGAAVGVALAVTQTPSPPTTATELGNFKF